MRKIQVCLVTTEDEPDDQGTIIALDSTGTHFTLKAVYGDDEGDEQIVDLEDEKERAGLEKACVAICGAKGRHGIGMNEIYLVRKEFEAAYW